MMRVVVVVVVCVPTIRVGRCRLVPHQSHDDHTHIDEDPLFPRPQEISACALQRVRPRVQAQNTDDTRGEPLDVG